MLLKAKQELCLNMMLDAKMSDKRIVHELNISEKTLYRWKREPEFIAEYESRMRDLFQSAAAAAYQTELDLLENGSDTVRMQAAKDILDRAGFKAADKLEMQGTLEAAGKLGSILEQLNE